MKVELLNIFGNDEMVATAARVSFQKEATNYHESQNEKLINFLARESHWSPFSHPQLQFRIEMPIYVERQVIKTQTGVTYNCLSGDAEIRFKMTGGGIRDISMQDLYDKWNKSSGDSVNKYYLNNIKENFYLRERIKKMKCRVLNEHTGEFEVSHIKNIFKSGVKKTYEITLNDGTNLRCTDKHKIYTIDGWKTIEEGLSTSDFVGKNGLKYAGTGEYQKYDVLQKDRAEGLSVSEIASRHNCSYHTIRKWLSIHSLQFDKEHTFFKKGIIPWNKGKGGYKLKYTEEGYAKKLEVAKNQPKGELSPAWRGGITSDRNKISQWTRSVARKVHEKYNYTCQSCEQVGGNLHAHHIIPVVSDISKAYDFDNLISVCKSCHSKIHYSVQSEKDFASKVLNDDSKIECVKFFNRSFSSKKLKVHFVKIDSIKVYGEEETYDIEMNAPHHNFIANGIVVHNSISGRYVDFSDSYTLIPEGEWRLQSKDSKQGSSGLANPSAQIICSGIQDFVNRECKKAYQDLMDLGISKEQARTILPLNLNTTQIWTGSLLAFIRLYNQRIKPDAQKETRDVVIEMMKQLKETGKFKYSLEAYKV